MHSGKLFYDDEFAAMRATIESSEREYKEVASFLFPDMKPASAYAKLMACVTDKGNEHLRTGQIIAMCRFCRRYDVLYHMADELSHDRPLERTPENQQDLILQSIAARLEEVSGLQRVLERINPSLRVAK